MCRILEEVVEEGRQQGRQEGRQEGRQQGIKENMLDTAKRMLTDGKLPLEMIANYSGLPLEEVLKLKQA